MSWFTDNKYLFGKPGEGIHSYRFMGLAIMDVLMSILGALLLAWFFRQPIILMIIAVFVTGIFAHWLFGVRTTVDKFLFP